MGFYQFSIYDWMGERENEQDEKYDEKMAAVQMEQRTGKISGECKRTGSSSNSSACGSPDHERDKEGGEIVGRDEREAPEPTEGNGEAAEGMEEKTKEMNSDWFSEFMNLPLDPDKYGNRGEYIATLTPYGIACYLVSEQKKGNLTKKMLSDVELLTQYFDTEVDTDGDEI